MRYRLPLLLMFMLSLVAISPAFGQWRDITKMGGVSFRWL